MLISKFNKLIHNKIVWAVFAVLVSLSMVGLFAPSVGEEGVRTQNEVGTLFGNPVSREDLMKARLFVQAFQPDVGGSGRERAAMQQEAWQRLAILRYAQQLGLSIPNEELSETIRRDQSFAINGVFSRQRYHQLIRDQLRIPVNLFEEYLREELLLGKIRNLLQDSLWISPYELDVGVSRFTDRFTLKIIELSKKDIVAGVQASDEAMTELYQRNPSAFEIPEQRSVFYVMWPFSDYVERINVPETRIQDAYDRDPQRYSVTDSNTMAVSYIPLEEVADEIRAEIAGREAVSVVSEYAMQFLDDLSMLEYGDDVSIHTVAAKFGLTVHTSAYFRVSSPVPGLNVGVNFNQAAFRLSAGTPEMSYSQSVFSDDAVYVLAWNGSRPSFLPPFEDVVEEVRELADAFSRDEAFVSEVTSIRDFMINALAEGKPFEEIAGERDLTVIAVAPFSVYDATLEDVPHFSEIAPVVLSLSADEMTDPIAYDEGALLVYVEERTPGDRGEAVALKPEINRMLLTSRMRLHFAVWSEFLLAEAGFVQGGVGGELPDDD